MAEVNSRSSKLLKITWIMFLFGTICDTSVASGLPFFSFNLNLQTPSVFGMLFIIAVLYKTGINSDKFRMIFQKNRLIILFTNSALLLAFVSSILGDEPLYSLKITIFRLTLFHLCLLASIVASHIEKDFTDFVIKSLIAAGIFNSLTGIIEFYIPAFNRFLVYYFGHMKLQDSFFTVNGTDIIRPMGFLSDANLAALFTAFTSVLILLNKNLFSKKIYVYLFFILLGYHYSLLNSRSSLFALIIFICGFLLLRFRDYKFVSGYVICFFLIPLLFPYSNYPFKRITDKREYSYEIETGRFIIWEASINAFKENPVTGIGTGIFFIRSNNLIQLVLKEKGLYNKENTAFRAFANGVTSHNLFIAVLTEYGIIGITLTLLFLILYIREMSINRNLISIIFIVAFLTASSVSSYAPYYKFYFLLAIAGYLAAKQKFSLLETNTVNASPSEKNMRSILIVKLCCIGDVVFTIPVIKALKKKYPGSRISYLTSDWSANFVKKFDDVDEIIITEYNLDKSIFIKLKFVFNLIKTIRQRKFDAAFLTHRNNVYGLILKLAGIKFRFGFSQTLFINKAARFNPEIHEMLRYNEILIANKIKPSPPYPFIKKSENTLSERSSLLGKQHNKIAGIFPFGGVNPGTSMLIKRWELEKYLQLAQIIIQQHPDTKILLFEGILENEKINYTGNENFCIVKNPDLIACCDIFISNDTSHLHIAAAYGINTVSVFGPTNPYLLAPLNNPESEITHTFIFKNIHCSPCHTPDTAFKRNDKTHWKGIEFICHTGTHDCMKSIEVQDVYREVRKVLNRK